MTKPIDLYYWPTPNGWKATILLEELGAPYTVIPVNQFPHLKRWFETIRARPAVERGFAVGKELRQSTICEEAKKVLFGQRARS